MDFLFSSIKKVFFYSKKKNFFSVIFIFTFFQQFLFNGCDLLLAQENITKNYNKVANKKDLKRANISEAKENKNNINLKQVKGSKHNSKKHKENSYDFTQEFNKKLLYQSNDTLNKIIDKVEHDQKNNANKKL